MVNTFIVSILDWDYHYKSVVTQIPHDAGLFYINGSLAYSTTHNLVWFLFLDLPGTGSSASSYDTVDMVVRVNGTCKIPLHDNA